MKFVASRHASLLCRYGSWWVSLTEDNFRFLSWTVALRCETLRSRPGPLPAVILVINCIQVFRYGWSLIHSYVPEWLYAYFLIHFLEQLFSQVPNVLVFIT